MPLDRNVVADTVLVLINGLTWAERTRVAEERADLLLDDGDTVQVQEDIGAQPRLNDHRDLLRRYWEEGIDAAFADRLAAPPPAGPAVEPVLAFISARSEAALRDVSNRDDDLLRSKATDSVFDDLLRQYREQSEAVKHLQTGGISSLGGRTR